jgi:hypothetical protein
MALVNPTISSSIKSIQRGVFTSGGVGNIPIAAVDVTKSTVNYLGTVGFNSPDGIHPQALRLLNSTTIERIRVLGQPISWEVIEYN